MSDPLVAMGFDLSNESASALDAAGIAVRRVDLHHLHNPYDPYWTAAFAKLQMWNWTDYTVLCWLDSDMVVLRNSDELMSLPIDENGIGAALDFEFWPEPGAATPSFKMLQSGMFVLKPSTAVYDDMQRQLGVLPSYDGGDQGFLTSYFAQRQFASSCILSSAYDYMIRGLYRDAHFNLTQTHVLHYVGHPKPWKGGQVGYEALQRVWENVPNITPDMLQVAGRSLWA